MDALSELCEKIEKRILFQMVVMQAYLLYCIIVVDRISALNYG